MKAAYYNRYGAVEVIQIGELPQPVPAANEVLVKVAAISINPRDNGLRNGDLKWISGKKFPKLTGADFSGVVIKVGAAVENFVRGDRVFGYIQSVKEGCSAEYIAVPQEWIAKGDLDHMEAAAIPCTYLTALQSLRNKARIKAGDKVLIYGASGGVGTAAIQLAKYFGADVTAVCSGRNIAHCKKQGAHEVLDYQQTDIFNRANTYDIFFQVYSKEGLLYAKGRKTLTKKGIYLTLIPSPQAMFTAINTSLWGGKKLKPILVRTNREDLEFIASLVKAGKLKPQISVQFDLDQLKEAQRLVESNHAVGKIMVSVNDYSK